MGKGETLYILTKKKMFDVINSSVPFLGKRIQDYIAKGNTLTQSAIEVFVEEYVTACTKQIDKDGREVKDSDLDLEKEGYFGPI